MTTTDSYTAFVTSERRGGHEKFVAGSLWATYLITSPLYFFESGQPQVADYLIVLLLGWLLLMRRFQLPGVSRPVVGAMLLFVTYVVFVNACWTAHLGESGVWKYALFYAFNFLAVIAFLQMYQWMGKSLATLTGVMVCASVALQFLLSQVHLGSHVTRATVFFNNPNQLGYFVVLYCSLFWIWSQAVGSRSWKLLVAEIALYCLAAFLISQSLSRAALLSLALLVVLRCLMNARTPLIVFATLVVMFFPTDFDLQQSVQERFARKARSIEGEARYRGYDRMWNHPEYLLFGAGEGAYHRFHSEHHGELHSTIGTVVFGYGIVGAFLFARVFWVTTRQAGVRAILFLGPAMAFGLTHNGLRQCEFWLLFAMIACMHAGRFIVRRHAPQPLHGTVAIRRTTPVANLPT